MSDNIVNYQFSHIPASKLERDMRIRLDDGSGDSARVLDVWEKDGMVNVQFEEHTVRNATVSPERVLTLVGSVYEVRLDLTLHPDALNLAETVEYLNQQGGVTRHVYGDDRQFIRYTPAGYSNMTSMSDTIKETIRAIELSELPFLLKVQEEEYDHEDDADDFPELMPRRGYRNSSAKVTGLSYCDPQEPEDRDSVPPLEVFNTIKRVTATVRADLGRKTVTEEVQILKTNYDRWYATVAMTTKDDNGPTSGVTAAAILGKRMQAIGRALEENGNRLSDDPMR